MILQALRLIAANRSRPSVRLLDALYGPASKELCRQVATVLWGRPIKVSAKEAQFGQVRKALLVFLGVTGNCIAAEDAAFEEAARALLQGTRPVPADFRTAPPPAHDAQAVRDIFGV